MKRLWIIAATLLTLSPLAAADRPAPPSGFTWREFPEVYCALQVPRNWHTSFSAKGLTKRIVVSPEKSPENGFDTGFTMQTVRCATEKDWDDAMAASGEFMGAARDAIKNPIASRINRTDEMLYMVVEGLRKIPGAPKPDRLYHVRNVVRAFPQSRIVYIYSFGALAEEWETAWKAGQIVFGAIEFSMPE